MDKSSFFSSLGAYLKANRPFFLVVLLIVISVGGYFWWQAGFSLDFSRFFAAEPPTVVINSALPLKHGDRLSVSWSATGASGGCTAPSWITTGGRNEGTAQSAPINACTAPASSDVWIVCNFGGGVTSEAKETFTVDTSSCPSSAKHYSCVSNTCTEIAGAGSNDGGCTAGNVGTACGGGGGGGPIGCTAPSISAGARECHTDSKTGVEFCIMNTSTFASGLCSNANGGALMQVVKIRNCSQYNGSIKSGGFNDPVAGCGATQAGGFTVDVSGGTIAANDSGTVTFTFNSAGMCGRAQVDACFHGDGFGGGPRGSACLDTDEWNILGKVINSGVNCPTPTPSTPPVSHLACSGMTCASVAGAGPNTCATDPDCWKLTCVNNACAKVAGTGANEGGCTTVGATCGNTVTHLACSNMTCAAVQGAGENSCATDPDCWKLSCVNNACAQVAGTGTDDAGCTVVGGVCGATPTPLACAPATQTVNVGQVSAITATGGTGTYAWTAPTGNPLTGIGARFTTSYSLPGYKSVVVASGNNQAACAIVVNPTTTPLPLVCSPTTQTVQIGQAANFQASGSTSGSDGSTQYTWTAEGGTPTSGTGAAFSSSYQTAGTKTVTVRDSLSQTATCAVTVATAPTTPTLTIQKQVRNVTQSGSETENANANPTDTVEFSIRVSSVGTAPVINAVVRDTLPAGLTYIPGSSTIDGATAADGIIAVGLNLGDMSPGRTITVRFRATVAVATFFAQGTSILTNTAYARGTNTSEVSDVAFVTIVNAPQNLSMSLVKMGRNVTRGETGEHTPVYSSPGQTIEFILRVRNTSNIALTNVILRDIVPTGITAIPGSVRIGGSPAPDALTGSGLSLGNLAVGQEVVVLLSGRVAASTELPAGTTTLINTVNVSADGAGSLTAQLPVIIENADVVVPPISTGPGESTVLALIVSGIITLLYVGYTSTDTYRRREVGEIVKGTKDSNFNFRQ